MVWRCFTIPPPRNRSADRPLCTRLPAGHVGLQTHRPPSDGLPGGGRRTPLLLRRRRVNATSAGSHTRLDEPFRPCFMPRRVGRDGVVGTTGLQLLLLLLPCLRERRVEPCAQRGLHLGDLGLVGQLHRRAPLAQHRGEVVGERHLGAGGGVGARLGARARQGSLGRGPGMARATAEGQAGRGPGQSSGRGLG